MLRPLTTSHTDDVASGPFSSRYAIEWFTTTSSMISNTPIIPARHLSNVFIVASTRQRSPTDPLVDEDSAGGSCCRGKAHHPTRLA